MSVQPVSPVGGIPQSAAIQKAGNAGKPGNAFSELIKAANNQQVQAEKAVEDLANGSGQSLHQAVLTAAKADLSFQLVLEMRNRLTEAFQEIMRMQV